MNQEECIRRSLATPAGGARIIQLSGSDAINYQQNLPVCQRKIPGRSQALHLMGINLAAVLSELSPTQWP